MNRFIFIILIPLFCLVNVSAGAESPHESNSAKKNSAKPQREVTHGPSIDKQTPAFRLSGDPPEIIITSPLESMPNTHGDPGTGSDLLRPGEDPTRPPPTPRPNVWAQILKNWHPPNVTGYVLLEIKLTRDGKLVKASIITRNGSKKLESAAIKAANETMFASLPIWFPTDSTGIATFHGTLKNEKKLGCDTDTDIGLLSAISTRL